MSLPPSVERLIELALDEDLGRGDVTSEAIFSPSDRFRGAVVARQPLVASGLDAMQEVFERLGVNVEMRCEGGHRASPGEVLATVAGPALAVLAAERTALNFIQRLSGIATSARAFADAVRGTDARVVDTRKTTPGYRWLEKRAVTHGGMHNHRADLGSGVLIKDNHIAAAGSVSRAVQRCRAAAPHPLKIEIEIDTDAQLDEALDSGADIVLLDNMTPEQVRACVPRARERGVLVEVSGGITLDTIRDFAEAGADVISVGAVTHSSPAADVALDWDAALPGA